MFKGSLVALVTPFDEDYNVNLEELGRLIEYHIEQNTDGIVILGTTGESATLSDEERLKVIEYTVNKVNKRIPVIAGSGSNNAEHAIYLSTAYESLGVDGLLVVTPYYNKGNRRGIFEYYKQINDRVKIPIILYNVPSRTGVNLDFELVQQLKELEQVKGIKEASGNMSQIIKIATLIDDQFHLYSGNDDQIVPILSVGGTGAISASANIIPQPIHQMIQLFLDGFTKESLEIQLKYLDLMNALFLETNPSPVKKAMEYLGFNTKTLRLPMYECTEETSNILYSLMKQGELL